MSAADTISEKNYWQGSLLLHHFEAPDVYFVNKNCYIPARIILKYKQCDVVLRTIHNRTLMINYIHEKIV